MTTREPRWVRADVARAIHRRQLAEHGGAEGIRSEDLLDSALHRPLTLWQYGEPKPDLAGLASAYAFGIARNHPFVDGNKRTAFVICRLFLLLNGWEIAASQAEKYTAFIALAAGRMSEAELADWLRKHLRQVANRE